MSRKKEIYTIAQKYNLLVLEDDPYWYLQFDRREESYFSMDTDGRVLRFDSLSKILSAGARIGISSRFIYLGWVSGPKELIDKIVLHGMVRNQDFTIKASNLHPSGLSQIFVLSILKEWGIEGFLRHTEKVASYYLERRDLFLSFAQIHLKGLAEWDVPKAGMIIIIYYI